MASYPNSRVLWCVWGGGGGGGGSLPKEQGVLALIISHQRKKVRTPYGQSFRGLMVSNGR